ncbi:hypothetical protein EFM17_04070 [Lactobacillus delbrueckii]|nr:hypothetical protein [Lactobacillus delbrueckii]
MNLTNWYRVANSFARWATEDHIEACRLIVADYAHVERVTPRDVLTRLSVSLIDPTGFEYNEYNKIRSTIKELMKEAS